MTVLAENYPSDSVDVGDIIKISGYGELKFEVISVSQTTYKDIEVEYEATEVEALGLNDKRNYFAEADEITIIERPQKEDTKYSPDHERITDDIINDLLDEIRSYQTMIKVYGENSGKGYEFKKKIDEIKAKLSEVVRVNAAR